MDEWIIFYIQHENLIKMHFIYLILEKEEKHHDYFFLYIPKKRNIINSLFLDLRILESFNLK